MIFFNDDATSACSAVINFDSFEQFVEQVKEEFEKVMSPSVIKELSPVRIEPYVCTEKGLPGDCLMPFSCTDVSIENYYTVDIEYEEE